MKLLLISIYFILYAFHINAESIDYLNQNDQTFYDLNLIPKNQPSSLCGPSSYINYLISEKRFSQKSDAINTLLKHSKLIKDKHSIDVNKGLIESDLVKFINSVNEDLKINRDFRIYGDAFESNNSSIEELYQKVNSSKKQIILLKLEERKTFNPYERKNRYTLDPLDETAPTVYYHFVYKMKNDFGDIILIDSEDPSFVILAKTQIEKNTLTHRDEVILIPQTPKAFHRFKFNNIFKIRIKSLIEAI